MKKQPEQLEVPGKTHNGRNYPKISAVTDATVNDGAHKKCVIQQIGDGGNSPFEINRVPLYPATK